MTTTWTGADDTGVWEDPLNWSPDQLPGEATHVILPTGALVQMDGDNGPDFAGSLHLLAGANLEVLDQGAIRPGDTFKVDGDVVNQGTIGIGLQSYVTIGGAIDNTGAIDVGGGETLSASTADYLNIQGQITGGGSIRLNNGWIQGAVNNTDNTITGYGYMGNGFVSGSGTGSLALDNAGVIDANGRDVNGFVQALVIQAGATVLVNTGLMEATNPTNAAVTGGLSIYQDILDNAGGTVAAIGANTHVDLTQTTIDGGTLETRSGGVINFDSASVIDGTSGHAVTVDGAVVVDVGGALNVAGAIDILAADDGDILLSSGGQATSLDIAKGGVTLSGGGAITLGDSVDDQIIGAAAGATLTVLAATIDGGGLIGGDNLALTIHTSGVIDGSGMASALVIDTGAALVRNIGLIEATAAGGLTISGSTVDDAGGGTLFAGTGATVTLQFSDVIGGTLSTAGTGAIDEVGSNTLDAQTSKITNKGLLQLLDGADVTLRGSLVNSGTVALGNSDEFDVFLRIAAATTLTGGGVLALNDGADSKFIVGVAASDTLTNVNDTISGAGQLGDGQLTLVNEAGGQIVATGANALVIDTGSDGAFTNAGLVKAIGAGGLTIESTTMTNIGLGTIEAGSGSTVTLEGAGLIGGVLLSLGTGEIDALSTDTFDGTTSAITNRGLLKLLDGADVTVDGTLNNAGVISAATDSLGNSFLRIDGAVTLTGGGALTLSAQSLGNYIIGVTASSRLTNVNNTIAGGGQLGDGQLSLVNDANGVIDANTDSLLTIYTGPTESVTNAGLIESTGVAGLTISDTTVIQTGNGRIAATNGSRVGLVRADVVGGLIESIGTAIVYVADSGTFDGRTSAVTVKGTLEVLNDSSLAIDGAIDNLGKITLNDAGTLTRLEVSNATLSGGGRLTLSDSVQNQIAAVATPSTFTNVDNAISGAGSIGNNDLRLVNEAAGTIDATGTNALTIDSNGGQSSVFADVNSGLIEATGAGGLDITLTTFDASGGGTFLATTGSTMTFDFGEVIGGTFKTSGTGVIALEALNVLDGRVSTVNNEGQIEVLDGGALELLGALKNTGTISLNGATHASSFLAIDTVLSGGGKVLLGDSSQNVIEGAEPSESLTNVDNTISGAGLLGHGQMILRNDAAGVIDGLGSAGLVIDTGANTIANLGLIEAGAGGSTTIDSAVKNVGTLEANGGTLTINAAVTGGRLLVAGGVLEMSQASVANNIGFAGPTGTVRLDNSASYTGAISGLSKTGTNSLDFADIGFVSASEASFVENSAGTAGVLTVSDGVHTAHIDLTGSYAGLAFTSISDGHGGTTVTAGPAASAHALVQAMATFTATAAAPLGVAEAQKTASHPVLVANPV